MPAADQAGAGEIDIEIAEHAAYAEAACPGFERVQRIRRVAAAHHCADRGADDDVRHDAVRHERSHYADMREAARRSAAERKTDAGTSERLRRRHAARHVL